MTDIFSEAIPELLIEHLDHLKGSAISLDVIRERGYRSVLGKKELIEAHFGRPQQRVPGILIPLHGVDGSVIGHQYRPDHPREDSQRGRPIKYENPTGSSVRLDVPPVCLQGLGDPGRPLWVTEGIKKVDALASAGACAIGLTGVWGFKGKNPLGGTTILADLDYITWKGRLVYLVFDSDASSNPHVKQALARLTEHLERRGAQIRIIELPAGPEGQKVGVDDYLAQGHAIADVLHLSKSPAESQTLRQRTSEQYCIDLGRICSIKHLETGGETTEALCNFNARVADITSRDNGVELSRSFMITGTDKRGVPLPVVEVPTTEFMSMSWVTREWDVRAVVAAKQTAKSRLCEAMLLQSEDARIRSVYSHTGWREVDGNHVFLTAGGAIGGVEVEVDIDEALKLYALPPPVSDPVESIRASRAFLGVAPLGVTLPLWAAMYLAPLAEILDTAFTLFVVGASGTFKSTLTALALNHFGPLFDEYHLPAAWRDTENRLEKLLFLAKDLPLVIDDWAPGSDTAKARELEAKAEHVIRAQGNRQGRGRLKSDTSSRRTYTPRGMLITSGEQLPSGHSHTARILSVEIDKGDVQMPLLSEAQQQRQEYSVAMTHYVLWLQKHWGELRSTLPGQYQQLRGQCQASEYHPRLAGVVAMMHLGLRCALDFLQDFSVITETEMKQISQEGMNIFLRLAAAQAERIEAERPGKRFLELLKSGIAEGRFVFHPLEEEVPRKPIPGQTAIGWSDLEGLFVLNPPAAYAAIKQYAQHADAPFTFKAGATWKDLVQIRAVEPGVDKTSVVKKIYGHPYRVIKLGKGVMDGAFVNM